MTERNFWTHGVNTIVEFPERVSLLQHAGWGTLIRQPTDPPGRHNNWFHLPLHTPGSIVGRARGDRLDLYNALFGYARLKANLNENATIRELHIRAGQRLIYVESVELRGPNVDRQVDARTPIRGGFRLHDINDDGLELSIRVEFLSGTPEGQIIFYGAGAYYSHV
jgi:hypothetical protein